MGGAGGKKRGRKVGSQIRDNIVELLFFVKEGYGYDLYKKYVKVFGNASMRSVYYNLNKGVELGTFKVKKIEKIKGDYSWGDGVQRTVYELDKGAAPKGDKTIKSKINEK